MAAVGEAEEVQVEEVQAAAVVVAEEVAIATGSEGPEKASVDPVSHLCSRGRRRFRM